MRDEYHEGHTGRDLVGGALSPFYWDINVTANVIYYYRVTVVSTTGVESNFDSSDIVSAMQLDYDNQAPPPPSGFKAWAPATGPDMLGVYLNWCKEPAPDPRAGDAALPVGSFTVYRSQSSGGPYTHKVTIPLGCFDEDANGNRTKRCVIAGSPILDNGGLWVYQPPVPQSSCSGTACAILDLTLSGHPQKAMTVVQQNDYNYYYVVTAVGATGKESRPSFENVGYLNYCGTGAGCERRDADGNGEYLVCGDRASLASEEAGYSEDRPEGNDVHGESQLAELASYRVIGVPPPPGNPYSPPARFVFYHLDHLGSARAVLDASANLISTHSYLPFGEERPNLPDYSLNNRHFTGHERDKESGLDYMLARYYSSSLGRFMAVDPQIQSANQGEPQTWNRFSYAQSNPINFVDPDGQTPIKAVAKAVKLLRREMVVITKGLSRADAIRLAKEGEDILAENRRVAKEIATAVGNGKRPILERHGTGFRYHFHAFGREGGHIFFSVATALTLSSYAEGHGGPAEVAASVGDFFNPLTFPQDIIDLYHFFDDEPPEFTDLPTPDAGTAEGQAWAPDPEGAGKQLRQDVLGRLGADAGGSQNHGQRARVLTDGVDASSP
jgi:RHS repeat-associated protein